MICQQCGHENQTEAMFCSKCGTPLGSMPPPVPITTGGGLERAVRERLAHKYKVIKELGCGGMAVVYQAIDLQLDRPVALKVLPIEQAHKQELVMRFKREAKLAAGLHHPNIIPIFSVGSSGDIHYFTMALMAGSSLEQRIQKGLPVDTSLAIIRQVAEALDYAHQKGLIHRDIKPANIMFDEHGTAFVLDFGIAKALTHTQMTATRSFFGSPHYMSPEQVIGDKVDGRADLYALGVMFYQMLTGNLPFTGQEALAIMYRHVNEPAPNPTEVRPDIPDAVSDMALKLMAKNPDERYQCGRELVDDLNSFTGYVETQPPMPGSSEEEIVELEPEPPDRRTRELETRERFESLGAGHDTFLRRNYDSFLKASLVVRLSIMTIPLLLVLIAAGGIMLLSRQPGEGNAEPVPDATATEPMEVVEAAAAPLEYVPGPDEYKERADAWYFPIRPFSDKDGPNWCPAVEVLSGVGVAEVYEKPKKKPPVKTRPRSTSKSPVRKPVVKKVPAPKPQKTEAEKERERVREVLSEVTFVAVPGGFFKMGRRSAINKDEGPVHTVQVRSFAISKTEVTQKLWEAVMGNNPSCNKGTYLPVENVSWEDVSEFITRLNQMLGEAYRLPTEAEWEYACTGGNPDSMVKNVSRVAWFNKNSGGRTRPVGAKEPNRFGLFDMQGNVWEWCEDWYDKRYYRSSPGDNPQGPSTGVRKVIRGGSWSDKAGHLRPTNRDSFLPHDKDCTVGFRLLKDNP